MKKFKGQNRKQKKCYTKPVNNQENSEYIAFNIIMPKYQLFA